MTHFKKHIQLLLGLVSINYTANANFGELEASFEIKPNKTTLEQNNIFVDACQRLEVLEKKTDLLAQEIDEGTLLNEMVGQACENPLEYKMASISHKIQGL